IGIVITPLWMGMFIQGSQVDFDMGSIYIKLLLEILLPVVLGISMQKYWGEFAKAYQKQLTLFDKSVILLIIYKSFGHSFEAKVFESIDFLTILIIFILTLVLFYLIFFVTGFIAKALNFSKEDQITAQFCGTKKSLVHGTVFSKILFPTSFPIGILLLPLMIFHAIQIFIISVIATRMARENEIQKK
ncbi:MAG TPA: bile acid:sodium symporter, partial [Saprospiraceae bacterium]|nr:bile acid:sodium symporter [Saprospiraceae bacterium]